MGEWHQSNHRAFSSKKLVIAILAAGKSHRFEGNKLATAIIDKNEDDDLHTQPLIAHSADKLNYLADYLHDRDFLRGYGC